MLFRCSWNLSGRGPEGVFGRLLGCVGKVFEWSVEGVPKMFEMCVDGVQ